MTVLRKGSGNTVSNKQKTRKLDFDKAVTDAYPFKNDSQIFADFDAHYDENFKVLIDFQ